MQYPLRISFTTLHPCARTIVYTTKLHPELRFSFSEVQPGVYLHRAQQSVFRFCFPPKNLITTIASMYTHVCSYSTLHVPTVLHRQLFRYNNISVTLSFPRFAQEGAQPPPAPTPVGHQGGPAHWSTLSFCFPPKTFTPERTLPTRTC